MLNLINNDSPRQAVDSIQLLVLFDYITYFTNFTLIRLAGLFGSFTFVTVIENEGALSCEILFLLVSLNSFHFLRGIIETSSKFFVVSIVCR